MQTSHSKSETFTHLKPSLVITTKNRKEDLRVALTSAYTQSVGLEVLVIDDGSTDGTATMVADEFPRAILHRKAISSGYIAARNFGAELATGDVIFSIDDDAAFSDPSIVTQTLSEFSDPRIGAVAIPFIDVNKCPIIRQKAPDQNGIWLTDSFIGTAHAIRRDIFLKMGSYYPRLVHQGEEMDLCIRMLDAGYLVRLGHSAPIYHFESPKRDIARMDYYGARNLILFAWRRAPLFALLPHLLYTTMLALTWTLKPIRLLTRLRGVIAGWLLILTTPRAAVSMRTYLRFRSLRRGLAEPLVPPLSNDKYE